MMRRATTRLLQAATICATIVFSITTDLSFAKRPAPERLTSNQFAISPSRNNVRPAMPLPTEWNLKTKRNVRWAAPLGSATYNCAIVADGNVYIGTNNEAGHHPKYAKTVDLACLLCFDDKTGKLRWQYSGEKLNREQDWTLQGLFSAPYADNGKLWFLSNRCEVICLDANGFHDGKNNGPFTDEESTTKLDADIIWKLDLRKKLGVRSHMIASSSPTCVDGVLLLNTSHGINRQKKFQATRAAAFIAVDRKNGKLLWQSDAPGTNILTGQWSSPAYGIVDGVAQAIFAGGDGWLYAYDFRAMKQGRTKLLWKFDCNPKTSRFTISGPGMRSNIIGTPVVYKNRVFICTGNSPERLHTGNGTLWCIDARKRGDISSQIVFNKSNPAVPIAPKRFQCCETEKGDFVRDNPKSGAVWHFNQYDLDGDGRVEKDERLGSSCSSVAIANDLLILTTFEGFVYCLDVKTGKGLWSHDVFDSVTGTPLIVGDKIYIGDDSGELTVLALGRKRNLLAEHAFERSIHGTIVAAGKTLYIPATSKLFALENGKNGKKKGERSQRRIQ